MTEYFSHDKIIEIKGIKEQKKGIRMGIEEYLKQNRLLTDGAFGTYYAQLSKEQETAAEWANLKNPALVKQIHREYIHAGARLIRTNTFAANKQMLLCDREQQRQILCEGFRLAKEVAEESEESVYVAADIGPIAESLYGDHAEILEEYIFLCDTFLECGAEIFLFETFSEINYISALVSYLKEKVEETQRKMPFVMAQFCLNRYGYSRMGIYANRLLQQAAEVKEIKAVGFNCGVGSGHMLEILKKLDRPTGKYFMAMPNSSYPQLIKDRAVYLDNSQYFASRLMDIAKLGVDVIGGCCGTNPEYIKKASLFLKDLGQKNEIQKERGSLVVNSQEPQREIVRDNAFIKKLESGQKVIAVELDPPFDANDKKILERANIVKAAGADLLTFADSPMARARMDSVLTSVRVRTEVDIPVMPHISCRDRNMIAMRAQLLGAYANGIRNLLIVTGDPIPGSDRAQISSVFDFNSIRLMEFVRELNREHWHQERMYYGGALNYARANLDVEVERMRKKIAAGASYFLTQPIFSDEDIERIYKMQRQVDTKILCGIMPLVNKGNAFFIQNEITGIHVPDEVVHAFSENMTREEGEAVGATIAAKVMKKLSDIVDGYYFMLPFNRAHLVSMCLEIMKQI